MRLVKLSSNALLSFRLLTLLVHREAGCGHEVVEDACGDSHLVRTEISHRHDFACRKEAEHGSAIPMRRSKGRKDSRSGLSERLGLAGLLELAISVSCMDHSAEHRVLSRGILDTITGESSGLFTKSTAYLLTW